MKMKSILIVIGCLLIAVKGFPSEGQPLDETGVLGNDLSLETVSEESPTDDEDFEGAEISEEQIRNLAEIDVARTWPKCLTTPPCTKRCYLGFLNNAEGQCVCQCKKSGVFEGDILIDENTYPTLDKLYNTRSSSRTRRAAMKKSEGRWPKSRGKVWIPYKFSSTVGVSMQATIQQAIQEFHTETTCIRFYPKTSSENRSYVLFEGSGEICSADIGHIGFTGYDVPRRVYLPEKKCNKKGVVLHELMHILGFWHEHTRADRDNYVRINWFNIPRANWDQYDKRNQSETTDVRSSPYDFNSIMHYHGLASKAINSKMPTIYNLRTGRAVISQLKRLSDEDLRQLNNRYDCEPRPARPAVPNEPAVAPRPTTTASAAPCSQDADLIENCKKNKKKYSRFCDYQGMQDMCPLACGLCD